MRTSLLLALALTLPSLPAALGSAQVRPVNPVSELSHSALASLVRGQQRAVEECARRADTGAYVADVRTTVRPGARPSTLYNAAISVSVRSRPRDGAFEGCVRRAVRDALRHAPYAVGRAARARQTFRVSERPEPVPARPAPRYSEAEARRVLRASNHALTRCLEVAGVPDAATLRVAVEPSGRLVLTNATLPPGASRHSLGCLTRHISRLRVAGRPARRVNLVHTVGVRERAY